MIKFEKIRFKNFGSFGNTWTEIDLDKTKTTLICGNNGSGKSFAFLDSITFALFGKPFRKINIPQLANSINEKGCVVEIEFMRGSEKFMVRRGINPRLFEIYRNGDLLSQDAKSVDYQEILENQILKMNYKTFTQVVILGSSSFVPFMQLSAADRRNVIENILDINIFSTMNVVLKGKILSMKETIKELSTKIEIEKNKIEVQKSYIATLERKNCEDNNEKLVRVKELTDKVNELTSSLLCRYAVSDENEFLKDIDYAENQISEKESKIKKFNSVINKITNQIEDKEKENLFFKENNKCRVCTQTISENFKKEKVLLNNVDISDFKQNADDVAKTIEQFETDISNIKVAIKSTRSQYTEYVQTKREIDAHQKEIKRIESTINKSSIRENIDQEIQKLIGMEAAFKVLDDERTLHSEEMMYHEFAGELLRDGGVKAKIIKYYLPHMNKYINKYLSSMDFFVQFNLDEEFNEQIKSRYRDEFSYMNFSEGEKMRIDLALLLAWREVARLKNSINCNLLILDEVFDSSLDTGGTDELMKLLKVVSNKTNVYVISHKADQLVDKFSSVVTFEKKNNFSRVIYN